MRGLRFSMKEEAEGDLKAEQCDAYIFQRRKKTNLGFLAQGVTSRQNNATLTFFDKERRQIRASRPEGDLEAEQCDANNFRRRKKTNLGFSARG